MNDSQKPLNADTDASNENGVEQATIGHSVKIHGDLSGKEDLVINGTVEGTVDFRENDVTVGERGKVNANVTARNIIIKGEVKGELRGSEQVTITPSGRVTGDIRAPRVILNDGCQFKGLVDMEDKPHAAGDGRVGPKSVGPKPFPERSLPSGQAVSSSPLGRRKL
jgi:cytoskeletal protein CcmA (bactofilin family)